MRFIRTFWGSLLTDNQKYIDEIQKCAINKSLNEVVYVWGEINYNFIKSLGYECILVSTQLNEDGAETILKSSFWYHKYIAIKLALKEYNEVIFLDWDVNIVKPIDDNFYKKIKENGSKLQIPLYTFPIEGYVEYVFMRSPKLNNIWKEFTELHYKSIMDNGYINHNYLCAPCTCFIYCSDVDVIDEFTKLYNTLDTLSDEGVWGYWGKQYYDLNGWILNCEPLVCNAKYDWHFNQSDYNKYASKLITKDLYFIHQ